MQLIASNPHTPDQHHIYWTLKSVSFFRLEGDRVCMKRDKRDGRNAQALCSEDKSQHFRNALTKIRVDSGWVESSTTELGVHYFPSPPRKRRKRSIQNNAREHI